MNLAAYRDAVIEEARRGAATATDAASAEADALEQAAKAEAHDALEKARQAGEASADVELRRDRMRVGREAHTRVLAAQAEALAELRAEVARRLLAAASKDDAEEMRSRLEQIARDALGEDVELAPASGGGVVAQKGRARLDYSLDALIDRCIESLGDEVADLWR